MGQQDAFRAASEDTGLLHTPQQSHLCSAPAPSPPAAAAQPDRPLPSRPTLTLRCPARRAQLLCNGPRKNARIQTDRQADGRAQRGAGSRSSPRRGAPLAPKQRGRAQQYPRHAQPAARPGTAIPGQHPASGRRTAALRTGPRPRPLPNSRGRRDEVRSRRAPPRERPYLHGAAEKSARVGCQLLHVKVHDIHLRWGREGADSARTPAAAAAASARPCGDPPGGGAEARRSHRLAAAAASGAGPGSAAEVTAAIVSRRRGRGRAAARGASRRGGAP